MKAIPGRTRAFGAILAVLGGFVAFCAAGAIAAFRTMARQYPDLNETGPFPRGAALAGPVGDVIRFLSHHFCTAAAIQLCVGLVLLFLGLRFMRERTRVV